MVLISPRMSLQQAPVIAVGQRFPDVPLQLVVAASKAASTSPDATCGLPLGFTTVQSGAFLADKIVILMAVPGAFTPTCSEKHLPGFVNLASSIKAKGVTDVLCLSGTFGIGRP